MRFTAKKINQFTLVKLPSAYFCGVRAYSIDEQKCVVRVKHKWFNQNPFNSMYFAVQSMAAELSTGALVMNAIADSKKNISMLVLNTKANFSKKATGVITFTCTQGEEIRDVIQKAIETKEGQTLWMKSVGVNENGEVVSTMEFEWTLKAK